MWNDKVREEVEEPQSCLYSYFILFLFLKDAQRNTIKETLLINDLFFYNIFCLFVQIFYLFMIHEHDHDF